MSVTDVALGTLGSPSTLTLLTSASVVTLLAELPDKTMITSIIMARTFSRWKTFAGASLALVSQAFIAGYFGSLFHLLPTQTIKYISAAIFFILALILLIRILRHEVEDDSIFEKVRTKIRSNSQLLVAFIVTFVAEFGDITQITTVSLSAHYGSPLIVSVGASIGLLLAATAAVTLSRALNRVSDFALEGFACGALALAGVISLIS